jgi:hypothetical protein
MSDRSALTQPKIRHRVRHMAPGQVSPAPDGDEQLAPNLSAPPQWSDSDYSVGYGRPPKHSQFKKGASGNKKGRPKGSKNAKTIARQLLAHKKHVTVDGKRQKLSALEISILQQIKRATEKGDLKALQYLTALAEGGDNGSEPGNAHAGERALSPHLPDSQDLEILAHHHREQMLAKGIAPEVVEQVMTDLGLSGGSQGELS